MKRSPRSPSPLPHVSINVAMTADGKIATANRAISRFSSPFDREHMMELRAKADAVMSGARTVDLNPVNLGPGGARYRRKRLEAGLSEYNLRIIVSGSGSIDPHAEIFRHRFSPIIILTTARIPNARRKQLEALGAEVRICGDREIDFQESLRWLRAAHNVRRLLCEGGGAVNGGLFSAGLVDEVHLTICPWIFGGRDAPTLADGAGIPHLRDAPCFQLASKKRVGNELYLVWVRRR